MKRIEFIRTLSEFAGPIGPLGTIRHRDNATDNWYKTFDKESIDVMLDLLIKPRGIDIIADARSAADAVADISLKPTNPVFQATEELTANGVPLLRDVDTEYKILNDIAAKLGNNTNITGKIRLFTELEPCPSCDNVILEFLKKYKNITIEVIHNNGTRLIP